MNNWPKQDFKNLTAFYGKVGENQTSFELPYPLFLAWDTSKKVKKITCHQKVASSLHRIFENTLKAYSEKEIKILRLNLFGGCLNVRKMRGSSTTWSTHSWGIAVDLDPDNNRLKWNKNRAGFAKEEYLAFWKIVETEGWTSLGRARDFDWMHFQATKL